MSVHVQCRFTPHLLEHTRTPTVLDRIWLNSLDIDITLDDYSRRKKENWRHNERRFRFLSNSRQAVRAWPLRARAKTPEDQRTRTITPEDVRTFSRDSYRRARTQPTLENSYIQRIPRPPPTAVFYQFVYASRLPYIVTLCESSLPDFLLCQRTALSKQSTERFVVEAPYSK